MLTVTSISKTYRLPSRGEVQAVTDLSFSASAGEIFTLLGPSGCGKSTTLRMIAGLEIPDRGEVNIGGQMVFSAKAGTNVPANMRDVGMVFQSYAIWPHMTVFQNAAFPLQARRRKAGLSRSDIDDRVARVLNAVSLGGLESREATSLSGGQQQRLALARAIISEPPIVLLDEPLSNLDARLRERMRAELARLQSDLGSAMIYVTHDQAEALSLSHRIAVMDGGRIQQVGSPSDIYRSPGSDFVAGFVGKSNIVPGRVERISDSGKAVVSGALGRLEISARGHAAGDPINVVVRPEDVHVIVGTRSKAAEPAATVTSLSYCGTHFEVELVLHGQMITAFIPQSLYLQVGTAVTIGIDGGDCVLVGSST
jgi:iron(III) transport system ATP-binding protein